MLNQCDAAHGAEPTPILADVNILNSLQSNFEPVSNVADSSTSVLRVKRKLSADPSEALLLSLKRRKCSENFDANPTFTNEVDENVFHYALTFDCKDSLDKHNKAKLQNAILLRKNSMETRSKKQGQALGNGHSLSLKKEKSGLIGQKRIVEESLDDVTTCSNIITSTVPAKILKQAETDDVEEKGCSSHEVGGDLYCNSTKMFREKLNTSTREDKYVYDFYFCSKPLDWKDRDILDVRPYRFEDFIWDPTSDDEHYCEDEDDENVEGNWRNDYPDEIDSDEENEQRGIYGAETSDSSDGRDETNSFSASDSYLGLENIAKHYNKLAIYEQDDDLYWNSDEDY